MLLDVLIVHPFLLLSGVPFYAHVYHTCSPVDGHLGFFPVLSYLSKVTMNIYIQILYGHMLLLVSTKEWSDFIM